ncbi:hypothetical protein [Acidihalobacter ferrooxydans]|uniref:Uncharacterized protein n=1 Tax=Acidihalobacter ferrooxydans TaxID=1765967 RepID=A0A1P8UIK4_9GAMM|nr:hypothetical protein [Acidihalobacter ferrooxydans]APZ43662.1 hypothetical protein BW247_11655 [Acidihalobacter ferrooxydans]
MANLHLARRGEFVATLFVLAAVSISPLMFVAASGGYWPMQFLAIYALLPALAVWVGIGIAAPLMGWHRLSRAMLTGVMGGIIGTAALEIVRLIGFRVFHTMPGSMPELIGVLMTNRFMYGPDLYSNMLGWADHFFNGVGFVTIYVLVFGRTRWWLAIPYALGIATIFMISPATTSTGIGYFGLASGIGFMITVYLAHIAFATGFGNVVSRSPALPETFWHYHMPGYFQSGLPGRSDIRPSHSH